MAYSIKEEPMTVKNRTNEPFITGTRNAGTSTTSPTVATGRHSDSAVKVSVCELQVAVEMIRRRFPLRAVIQKS